MLKKARNVQIIMIFRKWIFQFPSDLKKKMRATDKYSKAGTALFFNKSQNENFLPHYSNIVTQDPAAGKERFSVEYRSKLGICRIINYSHGNDSLTLKMHHRSPCFNFFINNKFGNKSDLKEPNIVYELLLNFEECWLQPLVNNLGVTIFSLSRRLTLHLASGANKSHFRPSHQEFDKLMMLRCSTMYLLPSTFKELV